MSLFNLTDIEFKEDQSKAGNNGLGLGLDYRYSNNIFRYPLDIGNYDKGHYMVINIGQQSKTQYSSADGDVGPMNVEHNLSAMQSENGGPINAVGGAISTLNAIAGAVGAGVDFAEQLNDSLSSKDGVQYNPDFSVKKANEYQSKFKQITSQLQKPSFLRTVRRTTDTIALYMPDTLQFSYNQGYSDVSLGQGILPLVAAGGQEAVSAIDKIKNGASFGSAALGALKNMSPFIASRVTDTILPGGPGSAVFASMFGAVNNPQLELLYSSPEFRTFRFEFMLYPRSQNEALEIQKIINRLRFHQAPEVLGQGNAGGSSGLFLVPPSEFDISFYYNGQENPNIPTISTCVLQGIDTDYAPNGQFSAYETLDTNGMSPTLGGTGMPLGIRLSLTFKETQIQTKFNYAYLPGGRTSSSTNEY